MKNLKYLKQRIRGWIPKEPNLPSQRQPTSHKTWRISKMGITFGFIGGSLGVLFGALAPYLDLFQRFGLYVWAAIAFIIVLDFVGVALIRRKRKAEQQQELSEK
jgi:uncharacterized membrane protein YfcA